MKCRSCNSDKLELILDLGHHAWCNDFLDRDQVGTEKTYPLRLVYCNTCTLCQLDYTVPKEIMFVDHDYVSGTTQSLTNHFYKVAKKHKPYIYMSNMPILDIGGNDGTNLLQYKRLGYTNLLNVESAHNIAKISEDNGIPTVNDFFNEDLINNRGWDNCFSLINASGVFFHLEELHSVIRGIKRALKKYGVFVVQFMYLGSMLNKGSFDGIYHEHLCYYSLTSLINLLRPYGLELFDAHYDGIHGGSIIASVCHSGDYPATAELRSLVQADQSYVNKNKLYDFAEDVQSWRMRFKTVMSSFGKIYGIGAPAKGNTLLTYTNMTTDNIPCLFEVNPMKFNKYTPVTHIPIVSEDSLNKLSDNTPLLLLSWNFKNEIQQGLGRFNRIICPFEV